MQCSQVISFKPKILKLFYLVNSCSNLRYVGFDVIAFVWLVSVTVEISYDLTFLLLYLEH